MRAQFTLLQNRATGFSSKIQSRRSSQTSASCFSLSSASCSQSSVLTVVARGAPAGAIEGAAPRPPPPQSSPPGAGARGARGDICRCRGRRRRRCPASPPAPLLAIASIQLLLNARNQGGKELMSKTSVQKEDPYLKLTGPTRAVVVLDPATFEVDLKVKGTTESEDQRLSFLAVNYRHFSRLHSHLFKREYASKLSELEFHLGSIISSVEATIVVRITSGSWPHGLRAQFTAGTTSIPGAEVILLDSGNERPLVEDGIIKLSRCVASVEENGKLRVCVKAFLGDKIVVNRDEEFKAKRADVSNGSLSIDFCREIVKLKTKTSGKGDGPVGLNHGLGSLGCCKFGFNVSWSVVSRYQY